MNGACRGVSLIEALVAATLTGIGVAALLGGLAALVRAETKAVERVGIQHLAVAQLNQLVATRDYELSTEGDCADLGRPDCVWSLQRDPTGIEGLESVLLRVWEEGKQGRVEASAERLVYLPPDETESETTPTEGGQSP